MLIEVYDGLDNYFFSKTFVITVARRIISSITHSYSLTPTLSFSPLQAVTGPPVSFEVIGDFTSQIALGACIPGFEVHFFDQHHARSIPAGEESLLLSSPGLTFTCGSVADPIFDVIL
jgi:hypothetical protein